MPAIFYGRSDEEKFPVPYHKIRATEGYLRHYDNFLILDFIYKTTKDGVEKRQALQELVICERKMKWMQRHPNYEQAPALRGVEDFKRKWDRPQIARK